MNGGGSVRIQIEVGAEVSIRLTIKISVSGTPQDPFAAPTIENTPGVAMTRTV